MTYWLNKEALIFDPRGVTSGKIWPQEKLYSPSYLTIETGRMDVIMCMEDDLFAIYISGRLHLHKLLSLVNSYTTRKTISEKR